MDFQRFNNFYGGCFNVFLHFKLQGLGWNGHSCIAAMYTCIFDVLHDCTDENVVAI